MYKLNIEQSQKHLEQFARKPKPSTRCPTQTTKNNFWVLSTCVNLLRQLATITLF